MKKLVLLALTAATTLSGYAQETLQLKSTTPTIKTGIKANFAQTGTAAKTTGVSDTLTYPNNNLLQLIVPDSTAAYVFDAVSPIDSGYFFGTNMMGWKGYSEWYAFNYLPDTTIKILGNLSFWTGTVNPNSAKSINFKVWGEDTAKRNLSTKKFITSYPGTTLYTQARPINQLKTDSGKTVITYFTTPVSNLDKNFFMGYDINYTFTSLNGDTLGLRTCRNGKGLGNGYGTVLSNGDTILFTQQLVQEMSGSWKDVYFELSGGNIDLNYSLVPIIQLSGANVHPTSVNGVVKNNLSFYGNYPNPAGNSTTIKIVLRKSADVTVTIMDMNGRTIRTVTRNGLTAGEQLIPVTTADLAAGNYVYMVRTSEGDAIASQLTVIK